MAAELKEHVESCGHLLIRRLMGTSRIAVTFNLKEQYEIQTADGGRIGNIIERGEGYLAAFMRIFLGSFRPVDIEILDCDSNTEFKLARKFSLFNQYWTIQDNYGQCLGKVFIRRRSGIMFSERKISLLDRYGNTFAHFRSGQFIDRTGGVAGTMLIKSSMSLKEYFTGDLFSRQTHDNFYFEIHFGDNSWMLNERIIMLCTAICARYDEGSND